MNIIINKLKLDQIQNIWLSNKCNFIYDLQISIKIFKVQSIPVYTIWERRVKNKWKLCKLQNNYFPSVISLLLMLFTRKKNMISGFKAKAVAAKSN